MDRKGLQGPNLDQIWPNLAVKFFFTAKLGQIVAKSDPNLANLDLAGLSCPWNPLVLIQNLSNSIKRTFLCAEFFRVPYGRSC